VCPTSADIVTSRIQLTGCHISWNFTL